MIQQVLTAEEEQFLAQERRCLADLLSAMAKLEAGSEDEATLKNALESLDQLFLLVVVGEFNAGKSALINSLLGGPILEVGVTPTTKRIHLVQHGEKSRELKKAEFEVLNAPAALLRHVNIVDTPGTNAIFREHETLTRDFIPRADLILFVTSADRPFTESERAFLEVILDWGKKIILVLNKIDIFKSPEELDQVIHFVKEQTTRLMGFEPRVFAVSARDALSGQPELPANQFSALEEFIHRTLDQKERIRLKFLNPLGVAAHLSDRYLASLEQGLRLLQDDLDALDSIDELQDGYQKELEREFQFRLAGVDNLLHEFEKRGVDFFEDRIRLIRIAELVQKSKIQADYKKVVIQDLPQQVEKRITEMIDWMMTSELGQWHAITDVLSRKRTDRGRELLGSLGGRFQYDRSRLIDSVGRKAQETIESYDREAESARLADGIQQAVAGTALAEAGAIGLGTVVSLLATSTLADVTGIVAASALALLGLFVIPARRREAKRQLRSRTTEMRARLTQAMNEQFEHEVRRSISSMREAISPYIRFIRAEKERHDAATSSLSRIRDEVKLLRSKLEP
jgi:small GTP-binding protein